MNRWKPSQLGGPHSRRSALCTLGGAVLGPLLLAPSRVSARPSVEALLFTGLDHNELALMGAALAPEFSARDRATLVAGALSDIGLDERRLSQIDCKSIAKRRADAIREDFERGRTIKFDGWLLSQTEVRLAVLAARNVA